VNVALGALVGVLVAGMLVRMPIGFSMIASGIAYVLVKRQDVGLIAEQVGNGLYNSYVLLAVPLFVFAANVMNAGTVSERIFDFCRILVGRVRGGLAQVDILVSVVFSGMSGSAIADAAGPGLVTIRQMLKKPEYSPGFAGAVVVASATLGPVIPPSIPMVIYALVSGASVGALFLAGVVPGVLMALLMMVVVAVIARRRGMPRGRRCLAPNGPACCSAGRCRCRCRWCCWAASTRASSRPPKRPPWPRCMRCCWPAWCTARCRGARCGR
jgi:C4-dicarboxylate transporter DctM subunit